MTGPCPRCAGTVFTGRLLRWCQSCQWTVRRWFDLTASVSSVRLGAGPAFTPGRIMFTPARDLGRC